jgi:uncharacterized protein (DUF1499 family)
MFYHDLGICSSHVLGCPNGSSCASVQDKMKTGSILNTSFDITVKSTTLIFIS